MKGNTFRKARRRPTDAEVMQFEPVTPSSKRGTLGSAIAIAEWSGGKAEPVHFSPLEEWCAAIEIQTLEGTMEAVPGDWIIKGVNGEFYPCKPDIFAKTWELLE